MKVEAKTQKITSLTERIPLVEVNLDLQLAVSLIQVEAEDTLVYLSHL